MRHGIQDKRFEDRLDDHISGTGRGANMKPGYNILKTIFERSSKKKSIQFVWDVKCLLTLFAVHESQNSRWSKLRRQFDPCPVVCS
jgi:hypothetical protein